MQLGESEAVGLLDDHDRRVRDVDADLDHRRRHEHVELPRLELRHQLAPLGRSQAAVQEPDAVALELRAAEPVGLHLRRARDGRLRFLDQRADDVGLPALVEMAAQPPVGLGGALRGDPAVTIGLRSAGGRAISVTLRSP